MTNFATGTGYWLDYNSGTPRFSIGTGSAGTMTTGLSWDGGTAKFFGGGTFSGALSAASGTFAGSLSAATGSFAGSLSAATGSFGGTVTVGSSPAVSGTTMTGSGAVLNSNGTFAIGNSTANISFNGSTFTFNGTVVGTSNIKSNAVSSIFTGTASLTSASWAANTFQYTSFAVKVVPPTSGRGITGQIVLMAIAEVTSSSATNRAVKIGYQYSTNGSTWYNSEVSGLDSPHQYYTNNASFTTTDGCPLPFNDSIRNAPLYPNILTSTDSYWIRFRVAFTTAHTTSYTFKFNLIAMDVYK
jgi:hypothetical protein